MTSIAQPEVFRVLLVSGLLACASTHVAPVGDDDANAPSSGGGTDLAAAGAAGGGAGAATSGGAGGATVVDPELFELAKACGVIDLASVRRACPEAARFGNASCGLEELGEGCSYAQHALDDVGRRRAPTYVCDLTCVVLEGAPFWSGACSECPRACVPPGGESLVYELDTSDCRQRPFAPCLAGFETTQLAFDAVLSDLLPQASGARSELRDTFLQIEVEDGCATRFYVPNGIEPLLQVSNVLRPLLAGKRFDCAQELSCGHLQGPDTLAAP